jgi:methanogenic corrinoid protein MtbC1
MERTYRIHIAAEMTGVSEGLIRAWERRYGVLKPRRTASGYRAYTNSDIEVLRRLKKLTEEGVAIAEAVRLLPRIKKEAKEHVEAMEAPRKAPQLEQFARWRQDVLLAAERLDQQAIEVVLDEAMSSMRPVAFFDEILMPLQFEVGERWHQGRLTVAEEHLVTQAARQRLLALLHQAPRRARRHVVCACFPTEDHELGLMGVALKFRHAGWRVTFLGARTPIEHLARVVRALRPDLVALSGLTQDAASLRTALQELIAALPAKTKVVVGGGAALQHRSLVTELGALVVESPSDWEQLLA